MAAADKKAEGNAAFQAGDYAEAVDLYGAAIKADDLNHVPYANRAAAYLALGKFEEARADSKKCLALDESFVKAYLRLATAEKGLGNLEEALKVIKKGQSYFSSSASGSKASQKKSGFHEFKKIEKELKAALRAKPQVLSERAQVEQAMRSAPAQSDDQKAQKLGQDMMLAHFKYMQIRNELEEKTMEFKEKQIICKGVEDEAKARKSGTPFVTYRAMGKGFLLQPQDKVLTDLQKEQQEVASEIDNLRKGEILRKRQWEEADKTLKEHFKKR